MSVVLRLGVLVLWLSACATAPSGPPVGVYEAPYRITETGLIAVTVRLNGTVEEEFIIDTASTLTTVTERVANRLALPYSDENMTSVYGFFERADRPLTKIDSIELGGLSRADLPTVVLENVPGERSARNLIGIDFFSEHALEVLAEPQIIRIYPKNLIRRAPGRRWTKIPLGPSPFGGPDHGLLFAVARFEQKSLPALIDTGAGFSALSWSAIEGWRASEIRRRLKDEWRARGAVGEFKPETRVRLEYVELGDRFWREIDVYIFELETLDVLGAPRAPLMVAGADLFIGADFLIDFSSNEMFARGSRRGVNREDDTFTISRWPTRIKRDD